MLKSGQSWKGIFLTLDATGALATPSVGPVGQLWINSVVNSASVTIGGTNPYTFTVTLPTLSAGDCLSLYVTATISAIATASVVAEDVADTKYVSDLNDIAAGALMGLADSAITAAKISSSALSNAKFATGAISGNILSASVISASNIAGSAFDNTLFKSNAIGIGVLAASVLGASNIGGSAFDNTVFKTGALSVGVLGASVLAASNIGGSAFDSTLFKTGAIPVGVLGASVLGASNIGGSAFDSTVFKAGAIDAAAIAACAITDSEFAQSAADKVWLSATRTLTQTAAQVASTLTGSTLTLQRGDSLSLSLTGLGSISNHSELWFTIKDSRGDLDANSKIMLTAGSALRYINSAAPSSSDNGAIVITSCPLGNLTLTISACEMSALVPKRGLVYDLQCKYSSGSVTTLSSGVANIEGDVTRAI